MVSTTYSFMFIGGKYHDQSNPRVTNVHPPLTHLVEFPPPDILSFYVWYYLISFQTLWEKNNLEKFPAPKTTANLFSSKVKRSIFIAFYGDNDDIYIHPVSSGGIISEKP